MQHKISKILNMYSIIKLSDDANSHCLCQRARYTLQLNSWCTGWAQTNFTL